MTRTKITTISKEILLKRTCSECFNTWTHKELISTSESKTTLYFEPEIDEGKMKDKIQKSEAYMQSAPQYSPYCPACGALSIAAIEHFIANGFASAMKECYSVAKRRSYIFSIIVTSVIVSVLVLLIFFKINILDLFDFFEEGFQRIMAILITGVFALLFGLAYFKSVKDAIKLSKVKSSFLENITEEDAKAFFKTYKANPFSKEDMGNFIPLLYKSSQGEVPVDRD